MTGKEGEKGVGQCLLVVILNTSTLPPQLVLGMAEVMRGDNWKLPFFIILSCSQKKEEGGGGGQEAGRPSRHHLFKHSSVFIL